ncbi:MAG: rod shape-determining protein RodA [Parcubacteria group bacterium]|nr:rod shape-determining protein RodA [Parcubacteria group bacterium]
MIFGLLAIYSVNLSLQDSDFLRFRRQIMFAGAGIILMFAVSFLNYRFLKSYSNLFYLALIGILMGVLFLGVTVRGTKGWIYIGSFGIQPVEFAKIFFIIFLSKFFASFVHEMDHWKYVVISCLSVLIPFALIILQPDFGSALVLWFLWIGLFLLSRFHLGNILKVGLTGVLLFFVAWLFVFQDYQKDRIRSFLSPGSDPLGRGYNITQSVIATGSGRLFGRGIGFGSQSQLKFLPESQTDFIFAVIAEELGFVGIVLFFALILLMFYRIFLTARQCRDDFSLFLTISISLLFFYHFFVNISMNIGLLPVTGISLPFVSYGGSFLISCLLLIGILQSIRMHQKT